MIGATIFVASEAHISIFDSRVAGHKALTAHRLCAGEFSNELQANLVPIQIRKQYKTVFRIPCFYRDTFCMIFDPPRKHKRVTHGFQNEYAPESLCLKLVLTVLIIFIPKVWSKLIINIQIFIKLNSTYI